MIDWSRVEYVGFLPRLLAWLIDVVLIGLLVTLLVMPFVPFGHVYHPGGGGLRFLVTGVIVVAFWLARQATPGKMLINAVVVDARTGRPASAGNYVLRYLCYFISGMVFMLGYIWVAFDERRQGWHDKLAQTVVVSKSSLLAAGGSLEEATEA